MRELHLHSARTCQLFGGGDDARQLENPIAADLDAMRPSVLPSLLAAAARNQARGFNDLMLFEIGAQFESGEPGAQTTVAAGIRVGDGRAKLDQIRPPRRRLRRQGRHAGGAGGGDGGADDRAGEAGRAGLVSSRAAPARWRWGRSRWPSFGEIHPAMLDAFDLKGPVAMFEVMLDAVPEPNKGKAQRPQAAQR